MVRLRTINQRLCASVPIIIGRKSKYCSRLIGKITIKSERNRKLNISTIRVENFETRIESHAKKFLAMRLLKGARVLHFAVVGSEMPAMAKLRPNPAARFKKALLFIFYYYVALRRYLSKKGKLIRATGFLVIPVAK